MTPEEREVMELALEALENNKRTHYYCDDNWYSCPKHEDGCANDSVGDECNCGADKVNAKIDKAITAIKEALAQPAVTESHKQEPVAWLVEFENGEQELHFEEQAVGETNTPLYTHPPVPTAQPSDWSVFNTGAEVASGLTFAEAWDYLTPERLDRGWSAVCVVNKDNIPTAQPKEQLSKSAFNMAVQGLAGEIVTALIADEKDGGYDLTAGMFGKNFSDLVRRWARAELAQPKEPEQEPVATVQCINGVTIGYLDVMQPVGTKLYATPQQRKPLTDEQKDAKRYRWLFNDVDLTAIKIAFDEQKAPPANMYSQIIEQIIGFYMDKQSVDAMVDAAIEAAHAVKE